MRTLTYAEKHVVQVCDELFWNWMARPPSERTPLDRVAANNLLFSCLLNRSIAWQKAMSAVEVMLSRTWYSDSQRMLLEMSAAQIEEVMFMKPAVHRYRYMAGYLKGCAQHLEDHYCGDARNLWRDEPTGSQLLDRLQQIKGIGKKTGNLFIRIAVLAHNIPLWDGCSAVNVSVDRHVHRVGTAIGLWRDSSSVEEVEQVARELSPTCPVVLDALFMVGTDWHGSGAAPLCLANESGEPCPCLGVCKTYRTSVSI